jgi:NDP-sugar pyrophosphorylase family protein
MGAFPKAASVEPNGLLTFSLWYVYIIQLINTGTYLVETDFFTQTMEGGRGDLQNLQITPNTTQEISV